MDRVDKVVLTRSLIDRDMDIEYGEKRNMYGVFIVYSMIHTYAIECY